MRRDSWSGARVAPLRDGVELVEEQHAGQVLERGLERLVDVARRAALHGADEVPGRHVDEVQAVLAGDRLGEVASCRRRAARAAGSRSTRSRSARRARGAAIMSPTVSRTSCLSASMPPTSSKSISSSGWLHLERAAAVAAAQPAEEAAQGVRRLRRRACPRPAAPLTARLSAAGCSCGGCRSVTSTHRPVSGSNSSARDHDPGPVSRLLEQGAERHGAEGGGRRAGGSRATAARARPGDDAPPRSCGGAGDWRV